MTAELNNAVDLPSNTKSSEYGKYKIRFLRNKCYVSNKSTIIATTTQLSPISLYLERERERL